MHKWLRVRELASTPARGDKPARQGRYPWSGSTIWRMVKAGTFPQPVRLSGGTTAWRDDVLDAWDASRADVPASLDGPAKAAQASVESRRAKKAAMAAPAPLAPAPASQPLSRPRSKRRAVGAAA